MDPAQSVVRDKSKLNPTNIFVPLLTCLCTYGVARCYRRRVSRLHSHLPRYCVPSLNQVPTYLTFSRFQGQKRYRSSPGRKIPIADRFLTTRHPLSSHIAKEGAF
ncbi:hypothetical protein LZ31DRAFT_388159 [Colletotrichum somersetense]|nr:hypothetical protein LZ31DRAFT_388159 [Colletotrichum somersetense]